MAMSPGTSGSFVRPASLTWLLRFEVSIAAVCDELFGAEWDVDVRPEAKQVCIRRGADELCVPLHPGLHAVSPMWAAQRLGDELHTAAVARGFVAPPKGATHDGF